VIRFLNKREAGMRALQSQRGKASWWYLLMAALCIAAAIESILTGHVPLRPSGFFMGEQQAVAFGYLLLFVGVLFIVLNFLPIFDKRKKD
jgi:hypothetical protein